MTKIDYEGGITDRGALLDAISTIATKQDAQNFIDHYAKLIHTEAAKLGYDRQRSLQCAKNNIGYVIGYGVPEKTRQVFEDLGCTHPVFGMISNSLKEVTVKCQPCHGTGQINGNPCHRCEGRGKHTPQISEDGKDYI
jgi:hypothetical protein